jgi:hypothetical protein
VAQAVRKLLRPALRGSRLRWRLDHQPLAPGS